MTLALELSSAKTLITHARTRAARFFGYEITIRYDDSKITRGRRMLNGTIALRVPLDVIKAKCALYRQHGKPWHRARLQNLDDYNIVRIYGAEYPGASSATTFSRADGTIRLPDWSPLSLRQPSTRYDPSSGMICSASDLR